MPNAPLIFNRRHVRLHRERAAARIRDHDFLLHAMAQRLGDRLSDVTRRFPLALMLGAYHGPVESYLPARARIETLVQSDLSARMIAGAQGPRVVCDEEYLPFGDDRFDLVMSIGALAWVNDLVGSLVQIRRTLKPGGMFLAMLPGGETLKELRAALEQAELSAAGGISPRVSPFIDVRDAGALLQRAGFELPVADSERLTVAYEHPLQLLQDLRGCGQTNALLSATHHITRRKVLFDAMEYYRNHFADTEARMAATLEIVTLTGWKPHA